MYSTSIHGFGAASEGRAGPESRFRSVIAIGVVIWIAVAAVLIGSNRPVFWGVSGLAVSSLSLAYYAQTLFVRRRLPRQPSEFWPAAAAIGTLALYQIVQILPLGDIAGAFTFQGLASAETVTSDTLSLVPGMTLLAFLQTAIYVALFILLVSLSANRSRAQLVARGLFLVVVMHAAYALIALTQLGDTLLLAPKIAYFGSATGTFINRNSFATFLAIGCTLGVSLTVRDAMRGGAAPWRASSSTALYVLGVVIIAATLVATQSRAGVFAGLCGATFSAALLVAPRMRLGRFLVIMGLSVSTLLAVLFLLYGDGLLTRLGAVGLVFGRPFGTL